MNAPRLCLYHAPGACSQVSWFALEEAQLPYELRLVNLKAGDQRNPDFMAVSPLGKVPALLIDNDPLTENAAILVFVSALRPKAGLLPLDADPRTRAEAQRGLSFCGGTLHPIVRGLFNPARFTTGETNGVRERAVELGAKAFAEAERRFRERAWWLGEWSIVDVYVNWAFGVARAAGFDITPFPHLAGLQSRLMERPAFARVMEGEAKAKQN